jgi:hypothetical protein
MAFVKSMISAWSDITPAVRGFEVVVLCCLGFRPSLGARTYSPSTSALVPSPCPGSLAFCAGGFQAGDTQLNSEVAPALTEIDWSAVSVSCRRRTLLCSHSVVCKTYVCRRVGQNLVPDVEWKDARWSVRTLHHASPAP